MLSNQCSYLSRAENSPCSAFPKIELYTDFFHRKLIFTKPQEYTHGFLVVRFQFEEYILNQSMYFLKRAKYGPACLIFLVSSSYSNSPDFKSHFLYPLGTHTLFVLSSPISISHPCPSDCLDSTQVYLLGFVLVWRTLANLITLSEHVPSAPHALFIIWSPCSHFSMFPCYWVLTLAGPHIREEGGRTPRVPSVCQASWHYLLPWCPWEITGVLQLPFLPLQNGDGNNFLGSDNTQ